MSQDITAAVIFLIWDLDMALTIPGLECLIKPKLTLMDSGVRLRFFPIPFNA